MTERDPVSGGLVAVPPGIDERHVLLRNGEWELRDRAHVDWIREFGGCMLLGSGQMVPHPINPGERAIGEDGK